MAVYTDVDEIANRRIFLKSGDLSASNLASENPGNQRVVCGYEREREITFHWS